MYLLNLMLLFGLYLNFNICSASRTNFEVKSYKLCNNRQGLLKYNGNITRTGNNYYMTAIANFPIPLDEKVGATCKIESLVGNIPVELFIIREKYLCKAFNMYMGELWYDVQRSAQVLPGTCPLPAGRYESHHILVDFNKVALQTFPFGRLRFTMTAVDNVHPQNKLLCLELEVENIPN